MSLKNRISAPLEAGASILDAKRLPSHVDSALEYVSQRLARKSLHISLIVVPRQQQQQQTDADAEQPSTSSSSHSRSSSRNSSNSNSNSNGDNDSDDNAAPANEETAAAAAAPLPLPSWTPGHAKSGSSSRLSAFKLRQLRVRANTQPILESQKSPAATAIEPRMQRRASADDERHVAAAAATTTTTTTTEKTSKKSTIPNQLQKLWPSPPTSPGFIWGSVPPTPSTVSSSASSSGRSVPAQRPNEYGIQLLRTTTLDARAERTLRETMAKAERRFGIGADWLPFPQEVAEGEGAAASDELVRRSLRQHDVLFSAEGLTLLSLDRLFTFKQALAAFSRTDDEPRLELAVDELRRYVLANGRRPLQRRHLVEAYTRLPFAEASLRRVARMYRRAYGGPAREPGFECDGSINYVDGSDGPLAWLAAAAAPTNRTFRVESRTCGICDAEHFLVAAPAVDVAGPDSRPRVKTARSFARSTAVWPSVLPQKAELEAPMDQSLLAGFRFTAATPQPPSPRSPPSPQQQQQPGVPALRLQTSFDKPPSPRSPGPAIGIAMTCDEAVYSDSDSESSNGGGGGGDAIASFYLDDEDDLPTAKPAEGSAPQLPPWTMTPAFSIDEVLARRPSPNTPRADMQRQYLGPPTPSAANEDISPTTRGEWEFLRSTDTWKTRTAVVETC